MYHVYRFVFYDQVYQMSELTASIVLLNTDTDSNLEKLH